MLYSNCILDCNYIYLQYISNIVYNYVCVTRKYFREILKQNNASKFQENLKEMFLSPYVCKKN